MHNIICKITFYTFFKNSVYGHVWIVHSRYAMNKYEKNRMMKCEGQFIKLQFSLLTSIQHKH